MSVPKLAARVWNSPTFTTWASFLVRAGSLAIILPLAAARLTPPEFLLWQLLATVQTLIYMLDLGVSPTFTRAFAYARGGRSLGTAATSDKWTGAGNPENVDLRSAADIWATLRQVAWGTTLTASVIALIVVVGTMRPRILALDDPGIGWVSVIIATTTAPLGLLGLAYGSLALGLEQVAQVRRWEAVTGLAALLLQVVAITAGLGLLGLVVAAQLGVLASCIRNVLLSRHIGREILEQARSRPFNHAVWSELWPAIWRSGAGVLCSSGYIQATGIICNMWGKQNPDKVSSYLLALRVVTAVSQFSQAPFYSRLPKMSRLYAEHNRSALITEAKRGMRISYLAFAVGAGLMGLVGEAIPWLPNHKLATKLHALVPTGGIWWLLCIALLVERIGAMHLQLYSVTNRIMWHVAGVVAGTISLVLLATLLPTSGVNAFPLSYLGGMIGYAALSLTLSYGYFRIPFLGIERETCVVPVIVLFACWMLSIVINASHQ